MTCAITLHYLYDPLCAWCYGAKPLIEEARGLLPVVGHGGGMMTGTHRRRVSTSWRDYVMPQDLRIEAQTGQPFGMAYFNGLLRDTSAVLDSEPPTTAILAVENMAGRGLELLARLQTAHFVEGRRIAEEHVLIAVIAAMGLDIDGFLAAYDTAKGEETRLHIHRSRQLMATVGAQGFPTLVLQCATEYRVIDLAPYLGKPHAFAHWLRQRITQENDHTHGASPACGLNGGKE